MADLTPVERLQPCLLDRLTDDEPEAKEEGRSQRVISHQRYRRGVLRDLEWLFNSNSYLQIEGAEDFNLRDFPEAWRSVINYGTRQLTGMAAPDMRRLQTDLMEALEVFEPRISARSLSIHAAMDRNIVSFEIEGDLWANPLPEQLHVKTSVDLETGLSVLGDSANG
ncbi:MAG TPA: type VI secretion system baseplate subunit TssE [Verrucomicrobiales bacterium]|nr:type VI secretion system baseplate subunit TssE [Verrucomicrobiales bacterium]